MCRLVGDPLCCFNTQPPEGGWISICQSFDRDTCFNTQPPEGGWLLRMPALSLWRARCFNTQPPEGGWPITSCDFPPSARFQHTAARRRLATLHRLRRPHRAVSTHSRPKAAGQTLSDKATETAVSTHSRPKAAGAHEISLVPLPSFQHTAARRRLDDFLAPESETTNVSTHSRPKAAG